MEHEKTYATEWLVNLVLDIFLFMSIISFEIVFKRTVLNKTVKGGRAWSMRKHTQQNGW